MSDKQPKEKKIRKFLKKHKGKIIGGILLSLPILTGTFQGNDGGFAPLYVKKSGDSYGIIIAGHTEFEEGSTFNGIVISGTQYFHPNSTLNGINVSLLNLGKSEEDKNDSKLNGLEVSLYPAAPKHINGAQIGGINFVSSINGLQAGMINCNIYNWYPKPKKSTGIQVGLMNWTMDPNVMVQGGIINLASYKDCMVPKNAGVILNVQVNPPQRYNSQR
jgi:hypothetical protein